VPDAYYDILEAHLQWLHQSPALIGRVLNIITCAGFLGFALKLHRPAGINFLFDGAGLLLYTIGWAVYVRPPWGRLLRPWRPRRRGCGGTRQWRRRGITSFPGS